MQIVDPCVPLHLVPPGSVPQIINGPGGEYQDLPAIITPSGHVITRWTPTEEERARLVAGEDLYLTVWTFLSPGVAVGLPHVRRINPVYLAVGLCDWTKA